MKHPCPSCGSSNTVFCGTDDGYGDEGTSVCDVYFCDDCEYEFTGNCLEYRLVQLPSSQEGIDLGYNPSYDVPDF